jgi:type IX secretion system PorP/SprF family membrane protein
MNHLKLISKLALAFILLLTTKAEGQGLHFSQYYNAPLLISPANTGLLPESDYRAGVNYRNQWSSLPVPYRTISAYADFQLLRNRNQANWLGLGVAFFSDKAGDGNLSLMRTEAFLAYHIRLNEHAMISAGVSGSFSQRAVDVASLRFDSQWDGFSFNGTMANGESGGSFKSTYSDIGAGLNYAWFPNENIYLKLGAGLSHINQPTETFYNMENRVAMRPTGNMDALFLINKAVVINPSVYYTRQNKSYELVYGCLLGVYVSGPEETFNEVLLGAFHRWNEAIIGVVGYQWENTRFTASYDFTISSLAAVNKSKGAFECSVRFENTYSSVSRGRKMYTCPRL